MSYISAQGVLTFDEDIYNKNRDFIDRFMAMNRLGDENYQILFMKQANGKFKLDATVYTNDDDEPDVTFDKHVGPMFVVKRFDDTYAKFCALMHSEPVFATLEFTEYYKEYGEDDERDNGVSVGRKGTMWLKMEGEETSIAKMKLTEVEMSDYDLIKQGYAYGLNLRDNIQEDIDAFNEMIEPVLHNILVEEDKIPEKGTHFMRKAREIVMDDPHLFGGVLWSRIGQTDTDIEKFIKKFIIDKF